MATTFAPDPKRDAAGLAIAETAGQWLHITLRAPIGSFRAGERFYGIPSSTNDGSIYYTNLRYCSCKDYERRGPGCKHQRAAALHVEAVRAQRQQEGSAEQADPNLDEALGLASEAEIDGFLAGLKADQEAREDAARRARNARLLDAMGDDGSDALDRAISRQRATA